MAARRPFSSKPITQPPTVPPAPQPPVNSLPANTTTNINTPKQFKVDTGNAPQVQDNDSPTLTVVITATLGYVQVGTNSGVVVTGNSTDKVTISGSPASINASLNGMWYVPYLDVSGVASVRFQSSDGTLIDSDTFTVTISGAAPPPPAAGPAPVNTVPAAQTIASGQTSKTFNVANSNVISVADADSTSITTNVTCSNGKITLTALSGGAVITNNDTANVRIVGTPAQVSAALLGLVFTPTTGFTGTATVTVTSTDGTSTDTDSVLVTVNGTSAPPPGPASPPFYPFGSRLDLVGGKYPFGIVVNDRTAANMDADLKTKYQQWKAARVYNVPGVTGGKVVKFTNANYPNTTNKLTVSEGMGYGMLLAVLFEDQATFDGLLVMVRARPAYSIPAGFANANLYLMDWALDPNGNSNNSGDYGGGWNAMDGDLDIAQALLMAHRQWGTTGTTWNYMLEAQRTIGAMKAWNFAANGTTKGAATGDVSRTSDYMFGHFRSFAVAMNDTFWTATVIPRCIAINERCQTVFSAANGGPGCLVPDAIINTDGSMAGQTYGVNHENQVAGNVTNFAQAFGLSGTTYGAGVDNYVPSPGNRLDWTPTEMHYFANAQRCPMRWGNDVIFSGNASLKTQTNRLINWVKSFESGNPAGVDIGYRLNGGLLGPQGGPIGMGNAWPAFGLIAAFMAGGQVDVAHQAWVNACYSWCMTNWKTDYYDCELMLLPMVAAAGNWWTYPGNPQTASIVNSVPAAQTTATNTSKTFNSTNGNLVSVSYTGTKVVTSTVDVDHGTVTLAAGGTLTNNGTATASVSGTLAQVNTSLASIVYAPTAAYAGADVLTIISSDGTVSDTDTVSITVGSTPPPPAPPPGSNGSDVLTTYFGTGNNQGSWLSASPISRFDTTNTSGVALTAYGNMFGRWNDRSGRDHDLIETDINSRPYADNDAGGPHAAMYHMGTISGAGGSTTAFYCAFVVELIANTYYGTLLTDASGNTGITISHNADESGQATWTGAPAPKGDIIFSVGKGTSRVEARRFSMGTGGTSAGSPPSYTVFTGRHLIEAWFDGTNINLRWDKGTVHSVALGASSIAAGSADMYISAGPANADWVSADFYEPVILKNACPTSTERDLIATYVAAQAGLTM